MGLFAKLLGRIPKDAVREFQEVAIGLAETAKITTSEIHKGPFILQGRTELAHEAVKKMRAIDEQTQLTTTAILAAAEIVARKYNLSKKQQEKLYIEFVARNSARLKKSD